MSEGKKDDSGKLRYDLIPAMPLETLARVYTMGAKKYDDSNWERGIKWGRIFAAMMRHLWAFWRGEDFDKESGLPHLSHAAWGCFTLIEYMDTHRDYDDRSMRMNMEGPTVHIDSEPSTGPLSPAPGDLIETDDPQSIPVQIAKPLTEGGLVLRMMDLLKK